ncbi:hypothetical protein [Streptomyces sp. NPDC000878]
MSEFSDAPIVRALQRGMKQFMVIGGIIIGAVVGFAGLVFLGVGLILFVQGSVRDRTAPRAQGVGEDTRTPWQLIFWLLKRLISIIFAGKGYSAGQRGMAHGLVLAVLGIVLLFGGLGTIAGVVATDQAKKEAEETVQSAPLR